MKLKNIVLLSSLVLGLTPLASAQITGSKHDFRNSGWNNAGAVAGAMNINLQGQVCLPCHAPHKNIDALQNAPLWSHTLSTQTYTLYSGTKMDAVLGQPDGTSKLCLSCHDGTVALENFKTYSTGTNMIGAGYNIGTNLGNDHPISFTYDAALASADGELFDPTTKLSGITGSGTIHTDMLEGGKVQCRSCHDPHNSAGGTYLLRKSNTGSALCFTCHNK